MRKRKWLIPVAAVLVVAIVLVSWQVARGRKASANRYATGTVERGELLVTVTNTGTLAAGAQRDIKPGVAATVNEVLVKVGDAVKEGQLLARLTNGDLETALAQAKAGLMIEQDRLDALENPSKSTDSNAIRNAEVKVTQAENTLVQRRADIASLDATAPVAGRVASLGAAAGDVVSAGTALATVADLGQLTVSGNVPQANLESVHLGDRVGFVVNGVMRTGTVSGISPTGSGTNLVFPITLALDPVAADDGVRPGMTGTFALPGTSTGVVGTVSARIYTLKARIAATVTAVPVRVGDVVSAGETMILMVSDAALPALAQAEVDLENAQLALDKLVAPQVTASAAEIESQRAKVMQAQASYDKAYENVDALTVRAPFSGTVTACSINRGDELAATAPAWMTVADFSAMSVAVPVDELDVSRIQLGMKASVTVEAAAGAAFEAAVSSISAQGTTNQGVTTYPVKLTLTSPKGLMAGMTANVTIICDERADALYVPLEAVQTVRDRSVVRTLTADGAVLSVEVTTGLANDTSMEILSGLTEGQTVVTGTAASGNGMRIPGMGGIGGGRQTQTTTGPK